MRKQLLEYDDVMNNQREDIYERRNEILDNDSIHETVLDTIHSYISYLVDTHYVDNKVSGEALKDLVDIVNQNLLKQDITEEEISSKTSDEAIEFIFNKAQDEYEGKLKEIPE